MAVTTLPLNERLVMDAGNNIGNPKWVAKCVRQVLDFGQLQQQLADEMQRGGLTMLASKVGQCATQIQVAALSQTGVRIAVFAVGESAEAEGK